MTGLILAPHHHKLHLLFTSPFSFTSLPSRIAIITTPGTHTCLRFDFHDCVHHTPQRVRAALPTTCFLFLPLFIVFTSNWCPAHPTLDACQLPGAFSTSWGNTVSNVIIERVLPTGSSTIRLAQPFHSADDLIITGCRATPVPPVYVVHFVRIIGEMRGRRGGTTPQAVMALASELPMIQLFRTANVESDQVARRGALAPRVELRRIPFEYSCLSRGTAFRRRDGVAAEFTANA
ncbi:hypothetical protein LA080_005882 [Diaporthe eres]|nr:hypothetical protein LA080_005882 [Diaporthe eres]